MKISNALLLILILAAVFALRLPSCAETVLAWDESVYLYVARDTLTGGVPYKTSFDHKGPLLYCILLPVVRFFGKSIWALRIFSTMYVLASISFVYLISKKIIGDRRALIPPLVYGVFFSMPKFGGLASNSELFMMLPVIIATFFFVGYLLDDRASGRALFLCGLFSSAAVLVKGAAFFTVAIFPVAMVLRKCTRPEYGMPRFLKDGAWLLAGGIVPLAAFAGYFARHGAFGDFYDACVTYNLRYIGTLSRQEAFGRMCGFLKNAFVSDVTTVLASVGALFLMVKRKADPRERGTALFVVGLLVLSLFGVYSGRRMFGHYYLQMAFPFSLVIGAALYQSGLKQKHAERLVVAVIIATAVYALRPARITAFTQTVRNSEENPLVAVSDYVASRTEKDDTIFVLGGESLIYVLSERASPTKYFYWKLHSGPWRKTLDIRDQTLTSLSLKRPEYFVYKPAGKGVDYLEDFMRKHYREEKRFGEYRAYRINHGR